MIAIVVLIIIVAVLGFLFKNEFNSVFSSVTIMTDEYGMEYFMGKDNSRMRDQVVKYKGDSYLTDEDGYIIKDTWIGTNYYDKDGKMVRDYWYQDPATNVYYYVDKNGNYVTNNVVEVDKKLYAFDEEGKLYLGQFFTCPTDASKFMLADENGEVLRGNRFFDLNGFTYYADGKGYLKKNEWAEIDGDWYYFFDDCSLAKSRWLEMTYYVDDNGKMLKNTKSPEGYEIDKDGKVLDKYKVFLMGNVSDEEIYDMGYSVIEGTVTALTGSSNLSFIPDATVKFYDSSSQVGQTTTNAEGKYRYYLPKGQYRLVIDADGYNSVETTQNIGESQTQYAELAQLFVVQSGVGTAAGILTNALNGSPVAGATLRLRNGWNITSGDYVSNAQTTTGSNGVWSFSNVPVGYYTVEAKKDDFIDEHFNIAVLNQNAVSNYAYSINPVMPNDGCIRVVLSWGTVPADLDSHLIGRKPNGDYFDVYYANKEYVYNGTAMANLDVDDTNGEGPETETITSEVNGVYVYGVHDFTNRGNTNSTALSYSGCVVNLYVGSSIVARYNVPTGRVGTFWEVFRIDGSGNIVPVNRIYNYSPNKGDYTELGIAAYTNPRYSSVENVTSNSSSSSSSGSSSSSSSGSSSSSSSGSSGTVGGFSIERTQKHEDSYDYNDNNAVSIIYRVPTIRGEDEDECSSINEAIENAMEELLMDVHDIIDNDDKIPKSVTFTSPTIKTATNRNLKIKFSGTYKYKDSSNSSNNLNYTFTYDRTSGDFTMVRG